jgi:hypothetical protein
VVTGIITGADGGRIYVQVTAPVAEAKKVMMDFPSGAPQVQGFPWIPLDLSTPVPGAGYSAAGKTLTFTLVPITQGLEGPVLVTVVASPAMQTPLVPAIGRYTGTAWYPVAPGSPAAPPAGPDHPAASTLWDSLSAALAGFPGGAPVALGVGGVALLLFMKKKQG